MNNINICRGQSCAQDEYQAVQEFYAAVMQKNTELVIFFSSSQYDLNIIAKEINRLFEGVQVVGCTTAGEIGPSGYCLHSLTGVSFSSDSFITADGLLEHLSNFDVAETYHFAQNLLQRLESRAPNLDTKKCFAFMLIDGLSMREEPVAFTLQHSLGKIPLFGGSAGDDQKFTKTQVYSNGRFHSDSAVLVILNTSLPFKLFKTQHFVPTDERLVVTEANPDYRIVNELNGFPATKEYARLVGVESGELNPLHFANSPVVVMIDGTDYVRSIQKTNLDGSLTFYCAIEDGIVLRVAHGINLIENLEQAFDKIKKEIGPLQLVLGCDCILRNLEISRNDMKKQVEKIFLRNNAIGFCSYGEQYLGVHVNQTFTGCALGYEPDADNGGLNVQ
jgi:hypothetical protein